MTSLHEAQTSVAKRDGSPRSAGGLPRVLLVAANLEEGGPGFCRQLVARYVDREQFDLELCTLGPGGELADGLADLGVPVHRLGYRGSLSLRAPAGKLALLRSLTRLMRRGQYDVVQSALFHENVYARIAGRRAGVPVIICEETSTFPYPSLAGYLSLPVEFALARLATAVLPVSRASAEGLRRWLLLGPPRVIVLNPCVDAVRLQPTRGPAGVRAELGLSQSDLVVGTVGRLAPEKGTRYLLAAFREVARAIPSAKLLVVGDGDLRRPLQQLSRALGLEARVVWAGMRHDVGNLLQVMNVFAFPSLFEGFGLAVQEALWHGVPVVASALPGVKEMVTEDWGRLVPPRHPRRLADALVTLLQDESLRARLGRAGREMARREFAPQRYVRRLEKIWRDALTRRGVLVA